MQEDQLFDRLEATLERLGARRLDGEEFRHPPLDVLEYHARPVRVSWLPVLGRALSVVATVRQPLDLPFDDSGCTQFLDRVTRAINARFPRLGPTGGLAVGLTLIVLTPQPISPDDEAVLERALLTAKRSRVVPFGWFRLNLGQEALALAVRKSPRNLFPEALELAELLSAGLKRFVPLVQG